MNRRDFLRSVGIASASLALPATGRLFAESAMPTERRKSRRFIWASSRFAAA